MTQDQCNELRDILFAARFTSGHKENIFRFLAVLPGGEGGGDATVHYAYAPAVWERGEENRDAETLLRNLIANSSFAKDRLDLKFHPYLRNGWLLPWKLTAKSSTDDFPTLVLIELADGAVTGALMRDPHTGSTLEKLAEAAEPEEAADIIRRLRALPTDAKHLTWYKDSNIFAASLEEAIATTPETEVGQKAVLLYRDFEWFMGIWNNPAKGQHWKGLDHLQSVADFHGTRVSKAKRATRVGLDIVRAKQTIPGDPAILRKALRALPLHQRPDPSTDLESWPAVKVLCDWWNTQAPAEMRSAGLFRTYIWDEADLVFIPGDPEEPVAQAEQLAAGGVFSLFEPDGQPVIAVEFYRGRAFNTDSGGGTQTYLANGDEAMDIGLDIAQVNEAYYSILGLQSVRSHWR